MFRSLAICSQHAINCSSFVNCSVNRVNLLRSSCVGAGTAHPSTTATEPQQHVASTGVQCETELWLEPPPAVSWDPEDAMQQPNGLQSQSDTVAAAAVVSTDAANGTADSKHALHPECLPGCDRNGSSSINGSSSSSSSSSSRSQATRGQHEANGQQCAAEWACTEIISNLQRQYLADRQQQQQQSTAVPSAAATAGMQEQQQTDGSKDFQKNLVRRLRTCVSIVELQELIEQQGAQMDCMSLTSCCSTAARLAQQKQQEHEPQKQHLQQDLPKVQGNCEQQVPLLQHVQETAQLQQLLQQGQVQQEQQQQRVPNARQQLQALMRQQLLPLLQRKLTQLDAVGLVLMLHSFVVVGLRDEAMLADVEQAVVPLVNQLTPRLLSQLVWCLGQLSVRPQQQLMRQLLLHSARQLQHQQCNSQDCAQLLQGLARQQQQPPVQWMALYCSRVQQLLLSDQLQPQSICIILHSMGRLSQQQQQQQKQQQQHNQQPLLRSALLQQLLDHAQPLLPQLPPAGLNMLSNGLLLLKLDPNPSWQATFLQATHAAMAACDARNASVLAVPLLRWRLTPPGSWQQQYLGACEPLLQQMQPQGLAVLGHALAGLQLLPPQPWRLQYLAAADACSLARTPAGCSYLIRTLAAWQAMDAQVSSSGSNSNSSSSRSDASNGGRGSGGYSQAAVDQPSNSSSDVKHPSYSLQHLSQALVQQCVQCFVQRGSGFTAEQLGMFCRGLAGLQLQGSAELAEQLEQVALHMLRGRRVQRTTAATLCNLLLALAASCPAAATPQLLHHAWALLSQLLHTVQPAHAAAIAWAASHSSSSLQLPPRLLQGLVQRAAVVAEDASQQQLAMLLLEAARAGWLLEQQPLQLLLAEMLQKQAASLENSCSHDTCGPRMVSSSGRGSSEAQHGRQDLKSSSNKGSSDVDSSSCSSSSSCSDTTTSSSSSSSSSRPARLYGLANHRLKSSLAATAAAAAWAHAMTPQGRMAALTNCHALALQLDRNNLPLLAMHVCCLAGAQASSSSRRTAVGVGQQQQQQLMRLPVGLAAVLWQEQQHVLPQLPHAQQQVMQQLWRAAGLCD